LATEIPSDGTRHARIVVDGEQDRLLVGVSVDHSGHVALDANEGRRRGTRCDSTAGAQPRAVGAAASGQRDRVEIPD
jgi:hypothetical protein